MPINRTKSRDNKSRTKRARAPVHGHDHAPFHEKGRAEPSKSKHTHSDQHPSVDEIVSQLRSAGFRVTRLRRFMLELLEFSRGPLSVADIKSAASRAKLRPNKSTVYRELYFLVEQGIVVEVDFLDGMKRYEFVAHDGHHHHMICTSCQHVECVDVCFDVTRVLKEIAKHSRFKVQHHVLEFFGTCAQCCN